MRGGASIWSPCVSERDGLLRRRARCESESNPDTFLYSQVRDRPSIAMAETEEQVDVGSPRTDTVQPGEARMGRVGIHRSQSSEVQCASTNFFRDVLERANLRGR